MPGYEKYFAQTKANGDEDYDSGKSSKWRNALICLGFIWLLGTLTVIGLASATLVQTRDSDYDHDEFNDLSQQVSDMADAQAATHEAETTKHLARTCSQALLHTDVPNVIVDKVGEDTVLVGYKKKSKDETPVLTFVTRSQNTTDVLQVGDEVSLCGCVFEGGSGDYVDTWNTMGWQRTYKIIEITKEKIEHEEDRVYKHKKKSKPKYEFTLTTSECSEHLTSFDEAECTCSSPLYLVNRPPELEEAPKKKHYSSSGASHYGDTAQW